NKLLVSQKHQNTTLNKDVKSVPVDPDPAVVPPNNKRSTTIKCAQLQRAVICDAEFKKHKALGRPNKHAKNSVFDKVRRYNPDGEKLNLFSEKVGHEVDEQATSSTRSRSISSTRSTSSSSPRKMEQILNKTKPICPPQQLAWKWRKPKNFDPDSETTGSSDVDEFVEQKTKKNRGTKMHNLFEQKTTMSKNVQHLVYELDPGYSASFLEEKQNERKITDVYCDLLHHLSSSLIPTTSRIVVPTNEDRFCGRRGGPGAPSPEQDLRSTAGEDVVEDEDHLDEQDGDDETNKAKIGSTTAAGRVTSPAKPDAPRHEDCPDSSMNHAKVLSEKTSRMVNHYKLVRQTVNSGCTTGFSSHGRNNPGGGLLQKKLDLLHEVSGTTTASGSSKDPEQLRKKALYVDYLFPEKAVLDPLAQNRHKFFYFGEEAVDDTCSKGKDKHQDRSCTTTLQFCSNLQRREQVAAIVEMFADFVENVFSSDKRTHDDDDHHHYLLPLKEAAGRVKKLLSKGNAASYIQLLTVYLRLTDGKNHDLFPCGLLAQQMSWYFRQYPRPEERGRQKVKSSDFYDRVFDRLEDTMLLTKNIGGSCAAKNSTVYYPGLPDGAIFTRTYEQSDPSSNVSVKFPALVEHNWNEACLQMATVIYQKTEQELLASAAKTILAQADEVAKDKRIQTGMKQAEVEAVKRQERTSAALVKGIVVDELQAAPGVDAEQGEVDLKPCED
ncbi:unnamed protein product, partial [Amoebophrya sp. A120]